MQIWAGPFYPKSQVYQHNAEQKFEGFLGTSCNHQKKKPHLGCSLDLRYIRVYELHLHSDTR